jgi:non-specific serine/threonine protein kinase/serine/threonine-protein kinase
MSDHPQDGVPPVDADATKPQPESHRPSRTIGPYRLQQLIGEGGMGEVWLAEQTHPVRRQVALKVIKAGMDTAQVVSRFEAERQALALMDHPAIATVYDGGSTPEGRPYFAMEYVKGESITTYCDRQRLTTEARLGLFIQVCEGVQHAHQKGIIHRDLKPSNVLVTIQDDHAVPRIIDFGVAKATARHLTERTLYTELGVMIGTPEYMSPEQAEMGGLDIDTRTDVYALGVILYELLTGTLPFDRKELRQAGFAEIQRTIREKEPPKPSTRITQLGPASTEAAANRHTEPRRLASDLRGDLDWVTMKALEKDRTRRYQTANALAADVRHHLNNEPVSAGPPSTVYRTKKFVRRHRFGVAAAATLVLLLIAFGATMAVQAQRIARERDRANREAERASQEAATAKQITDFLVGLFKVSDPSEARGNSVTAREVLDRGATKITGQLADQPRTRVRLLATMGSVYTNLGLYRAAEPLLNRAVAEGRRALGKGDIETLKASSELANLYWCEDQFAKAEAIYVGVVEGRTKILGSEHPDTLKARSDLANVYVGQRRWQEAEAAGRAVLDAQSRLLGPTHPDTVTSLSNLGAIYFALERYEDALSVALQLLDADRRNHGADHPDTLTSMHNLARVYEKLGRKAEAERAYQDTISARRRVLGEDHRSTSNTELALASFYREQERFQEAEVLTLGACAALLKALGETHPKSQDCTTSLVRLYEAWGKPKKAAEWRAKLPKPATATLVK